MTSRVEADWTEVRKGIRRLNDGIEEGSRRTAQDTAAAVAGSIRPRVPVRSGRLVATVGVTDVDGGAGITYGGGLPYATYIEHRSHAVEDALDGAEERFAADQRAMAAREVQKL